MPMYPPAAPVVSGTNALTVPMMLANPKLITRRVSDMALRRDYLGVIFADNGQAAGGASAYQQVTANDLFAGQKSEPIAPGAEYPKLGFSDPTLNVANILKQGAEFDITYEMRDRDRMGLVDQRIAQLANTITRDTQTLAMAVLDAAISTHTRTAAGTNWGTVNSTARSLITGAVSIEADLAEAVTNPEENELPYEFDTAVLNPAQWRILLSSFGTGAKVQEVLAGYGIKQTWVTNRQAAGKAKFLAAGLVGAREWEGPAGVQTSVRDEPGRDTFVVKGAEKVMAYVTDPFAILELTGLAG